MIELFTFILETIGTIAFSISGALVAIEKKMDILGVAILGLTTAVGGGVIRDVIIGNTPAQAFVTPVYALVALATALFMFLPFIRRWAQSGRRVFDVVLLTMDSVGLGVFTVVGIATAYAAVPDSSWFLLLFVGTVTGVGGGVLRDIMAGNTPYIFIKHFYACASLLGAVVCVVLWKPLGNVWAMSLGAALIVVLRLLAAHFRWKLPHA